MPLPKVHVKLDAADSGEVWVNDVKLPGVTAVQINGQAGGIPSVQVHIRPGELTAVLPETGVQIIKAVEGSPEQFVACLNPVELQKAVEEYGDMDTSFGEAMVAVLQRMAAEQ